MIVPPSRSTDRLSDVRCRRALGCLLACVLATALGCANSEVPSGNSSNGGGPDVEPIDATDVAETTDARLSCGDAAQCPSRPGTVATCGDAGRCVYRCQSGFGDPDGDLSNGCECEKSNGGTEACDGQDNDCDGDVDEDYDFQTDPENCGACGNECKSNNASSSCVNGSCAIDSCNKGWRNCDNDASNGCEVNIESSLDHCGSCGTTCSLNHATATCSDATCKLVECETGWKDCDGMLSNGCEIDIRTNKDHCGGCGQVCNPSNGQGTCNMGTCQIANCPQGRADCNGRANDGCETDTTSDRAHCGKCGNQCSVNHVKAGGCRASSCFIKACLSGWADCDGDVSNGCEQNTDDSTSHCGACNNVCKIPHAKNACRSGTCEIEKCNPAWQNLNGKKSDGCEYKCTFQRQNDVPDSNGNDENCDGIDGILKRSVFVATPSNGGDDSHGGRKRANPVATISKGISIAQNCSPTCDVLVSAGTYDESIAMKPGVDVYGGYSAQNWARSPSSHTTTIEGQTKRAVRAVGIDRATEIDGFTIRGRDFQSGGKSTYAVWVRNSKSKDLHIDNCRIEAGDGGEGRNGSDGSDGADGSDGSDANGKQGGSGGNSACGADGGDGAQNRKCNAGSQRGERGRSGGDPTGGGGGGRPGNDRCSGGCNDSAGDAGNGSDGGDGSSGSAGSAPSAPFGSFSGSGLWSGATGRAGTSGDNGRGGGGGGSGGNDNDDTSPIDYCTGGTHRGGGGGGGGAGGCAGRGGKPGQPGGGSFAVVLVDSSIQLTGSVVVLGTGGDGGRGGRGGDGGSGGSGGSGAGGQGGGEGGRGGDGASGGDGGGGGGGPGGCGGPSVGLAKVGSSNAQRNNVSFRSGSGGSGGSGGQGGLNGGNPGQGRAPSGPDGCQGGKKNVKSY